MLRTALAVATAALCTAGPAAAAEQPSNSCLQFCIQIATSDLQAQSRSALVSSPKGRGRLTGSALTLTRRHP